MTRTADDVIAAYTNYSRSMTGADIGVLVAEVTRLRTENAALRSDNALLAGAVRVWEPIERAPDYEAVLIALPPFDHMQATRSGRFGTWMVGARSIIGRDIMEGMVPEFFQQLPNDPDATRDAELAAAVRRATGDESNV
jgi:hypothetical protein